MAVEVEAHITGNLWKIVKKVGDKIEEGEEIMILESMKMEMPVESPCDGTITDIPVKEGDALTEGQVVAIIDED
ncbi:MAG: biotin/lipoyl-binding carrier protein [Chrysiogenetes bacterium]|nr:biotin/lipoyl-binding carrier protein [Chrysiogenetes bacterium]